MGAEVIKVESAPARDPHRMIVGSGNMPNGDQGADPWNRSGWFNALHLSKYGITPDIGHPEGKAVLKSACQRQRRYDQEFPRRGAGPVTL